MRQAYDVPLAARGPHLAVPRDLGPAEGTVGRVAEQGLDVLGPDRVDHDGAVVPVHHADVQVGVLAVDAQPNALDSQLEGDDRRRRPGPVLTLAANPTTHSPVDSETYGADW